MFATQHVINTNSFINKISQVQKKSQRRQHISLKQQQLLTNENNNNNNCFRLSATASDYATYSVFLQKQCEAAAKEGMDSKKWDDVRKINPDAKNVWYMKHPLNEVKTASVSSSNDSFDKGMDDFCNNNENAQECKVFD